MPEQETMQEWMKIAQPGKEHDLLARQAGEWKMTMRAWMSPNDPPMEGDGTSIVKSLLGGRILTEEVHAHFGDMPFEGFGTKGHDNFHNKWWQTWTDWMTTLYYAEGTASADGKTVTMFGTADRPEQNRKNVERKTVNRFLDDNHHVFEMYEKGRDGKEIKMFEIDYRRK